jgi:hypothetical protein
VRRKSRTLAWPRSMSLTRKILEDASPAYSSPEGAAAEAAEVVAEAAEAVGAVEAVVAGAAEAA